MRCLRQTGETQLSEVIERLEQERRDREKKKEFIVCKNCSHIITSLDCKIEINGKHAHTFNNPAGVVYRIGCFSSAKGCFNFGEPTEEYTWFPGFAWCYANCLGCFAHLGWLFQSGEEQFYGLILTNLTIGETPH
ncbi:MAG: hypothetical protein GY950_14575 [bacterium]|nr:hypothetical protein [bacterium]